MSRGEDPTPAHQCERELHVNPSRGISTQLHRASQRPHRRPLPTKVTRPRKMCAKANRSIQVVLRGVVGGVIVRRIRPGGGRWFCARRGVGDVTAGDRGYASGFVAPNGAVRIIRTEQCFF